MEATKALSFVTDRIREASGSRYAYYYVIAAVASAYLGFVAIKPLVVRDPRWSMSRVVFAPMVVPDTRRKISGADADIQATFANDLVKVDVRRGSKLAASAPVAVDLLTEGLQCSGSGIAAPAAVGTTPPRYPKDARIPFPVFARYRIALPARAFDVLLTCRFDTSSVPFWDSDLIHREMFALLPTANRVIWNQMSALGVPLEAVPVSTVDLNLDGLLAQPSWNGGVPIADPYGTPIENERTLTLAKLGISNVAVLTYTPPSAAIWHELRLLFAGVLFGICAQGIFEIGKLLFYRKTQDN